MFCGRFFYRKAYQFINEEFACKKPNDLWYAEENITKKRLDEK
jgi:hypothetical protein